MNGYKICFVVIIPRLFENSYMKEFNVFFNPKLFLDADVNVYLLEIQNV